MSMVTFEFTAFRQRFGGWNPSTSRWMPKERWKAVSDTTLVEPTIRYRWLDELDTDCEVIVGNSGAGVAIMRMEDAESASTRLLHDLNEIMGDRRSDPTVATMDDGILICEGVRLSVDGDEPIPPVVRMMARAILIRWVAAEADESRRAFLAKGIDERSSTAYADELKPLLPALELSDDCRLLDDLGCRGEVDRIRAACARAWDYRSTEEMLVKRVVKALASLIIP